MELSALERSMALRSRLLKPIGDYMQTIELLDVDVQDFAALQSLPPLELDRLRVLLPFLRATLRLSMHNGGMGSTSVTKNVLLVGVTSGWAHKVLRPKGKLLTTANATSLCQELGNTRSQAERQARALVRDGSVTAGETSADSRVRFLCPTNPIVTRMLESCIYWNVVRMLESQQIGGPEYFKLLETPKTQNHAAREMLTACRAAYDSVYGNLRPEDRTIVGDDDKRELDADMAEFGQDFKVVA